MISYILFLIDISAGYKFPKYEIGKVYHFVS
jgi:hypothetical protein